MNLYRYALLFATIAIACTTSIGCISDTTSSKQDALSTKPGSQNGETECETHADCGSGHTCILPGVGIGPVGYCFDDKYVYCNTWGSPAVTESKDPNSNWKCEADEVFALCQPELSELIKLYCRPAKVYDPSTEYFRYSCCDPAMFGE